MFVVGGKIDCNVLM